MKCSIVFFECVFVVNSIFNFRTFKRISDELRRWRMWSIRPMIERKRRWGADRRGASRGHRIELTYLHCIGEVLRRRWECWDSRNIHSVRSILIQKQNLQNFDYFYILLDILLPPQHHDFYTYSGTMVPSEQREIAVLYHQNAKISCSVPWYGSAVCERC